MKYFSKWMPIIAVLVFAPFVGMAAGDSKTNFLSVVDDLPLMAGLVETGDGVQFESPQGRIVDVSATGNVGAPALRDFYENTLPHLGWTKIGPGTYRREGEVLTITTGLPSGLPSGEPKNTIRAIFSIRPEKGG
ncbi:MAG: hypothetical protein KAI27_00260 [Rhodospirillaceae bacterium]|nr:hypothetical protein [Rhodospirillaceae bacterium]